MADFVDRRNLQFCLYEFLDATALCERERFADHDRETYDAVLQTSHQIAKDHYEPFAHKLDRNEPTFDGEKVNVIPEISTMLNAYIEAGLLAPHRDYDLDGMQLPWTIAKATDCFFSAANGGATGYTFLTSAAANVIAAFGSDEHKEKFMKPMYTGRFFGTMCLSEPHAGSSLSDITTKAVPTGEGDYWITGSKMWISAGEHELSENIIHLVLAKLPDSPPGVKGISLFIVPKHVVNEEGLSTKSNNVTLAGLNHKMGSKGTVNCLLNFGEAGSTRGYLLGEAHKGLGYMFHMMNEARIAVGAGAASMGMAGYLNSLEYAKDRPQGRHPDAKDSKAPQVPMIEHADVKRMLLAQKSYVEGSLALCLYAAYLVDDQETHPDEAAREKAADLLEILTPICKAWPSDYCTKANDLAIQVLGGAGYTVDYPVERLYRDNRLNAIHEGTNGIQAIDLLGRKLTMKKGKCFKLLIDEMKKTAEECKTSPILDEHAWDLLEAIKKTEETSTALLQVAGEGHTRRFLANAYLYYEMLGHVVIAWIWLKQAKVAAHARERSSEADRNFYEGKLRACQYFFKWELPKIQALSQLLISVDTTCLDMPIDCF